MMVSCFVERNQPLLPVLYSSILSPRRIAVREITVHYKHYKNIIKKGYRRYGLLMSTKTHYTTQCMPVRPTPLLALSEQRDTG